MKTLLCLAVAAAALAIPTSTAFGADEPALKIVVNAANPTRTLSRNQLSRLFLKKTTTWDSGELVLPVDQAEESAIRAKFCKDVHQKTPASVAAYWQQRIFSGRDVPPVEKRTEADVLAYVKNNPGAVGYVSAATDDVRVVTLSD